MKRKCYLLLVKISAIGMVYLCNTGVKFANIYYGKSSLKLLLIRRSAASANTNLIRSVEMQGNKLIGLAHK